MADLKLTVTSFFFEARDLQEMRPGSGIADKSRRDFGNEGKVWSEWRDQRTPLGRTLYYVKQTTQARNLVSELHFCCRISIRDH